MSYVGTEGYVPPEGPGTVQADLYALGKVLYELSTGKDRQDYPELPTNLKDSSDRPALRQLNEVFLAACERDPGKRYATAREMREDLERIRRGEAAIGVRPRWSLAGRSGRLATGVLLVVLALLASWWFNAHQPPLPKPLVHWQFDDPQHIGYDSSGNGHELTIPGTWRSVTGASSKLGQAIRFLEYPPTEQKRVTLTNDVRASYSVLESPPPNSSDKALGPHTPLGPGLRYPGPEGFTVAFWFKAERWRETVVRDYLQHTVPGQNFALSYGNDQVHFVVTDEGVAAGVNRPLIVEAPGLIDRWVHLAGTYTPRHEVTRVYINGELRGELRLGGPMKTNAAANLYVSGSWHQTCVGTLDDVRIYDVALSSNQVKRLYAAFDVAVEAGPTTNQPRQQAAVASEAALALEPVGQLTTAHSGTAAAAWDGRILVCSGYGHKGRTARVEVFDPVTGVASIAAELPMARHGMGAFFLERRLYCAGGQDDNNTFSRAVFRYDPGVNRWEQLNDFPVAGWKYGAVQHQNRAFIIGGSPNYERTWSEVWEYDLKNYAWHQRASMPIPVIGAGIAGCDDRIYVFGGSRDESEQVNAVQVYDLATDRWQVTGEMPAHLYFITAVLQKDFIYVFGSRVWDAELERWAPNHAVYRFNPLDGLWTQFSLAGPTAEASSPRHAVVVAGTIYLVEEVEPDLSTGSVLKLSGTY